MASSKEFDIKAKLIENVKSPVKQIMEMVAVSKTISIDFLCVTNLCVSIESCVHYGLRRKIFGLLKTKSSTFALLHKIAKHCPDAAYVITKVAHYCYESSTSTSGTVLNVEQQRTVDINRNKVSHFWIEVALVENKLLTILQYLINNASKYYESESIISDPEYSAIFVSLLVGPSSISYYTENYTKNQQLRAIEANVYTRLIPSWRWKPKTHSKSKSKVSTTDQTGCIESLHQSANFDLLYGKNNILIQNPVNNDQFVAGYLSLHYIHHPDRDELVLKWTANQLILNVSEIVEYNKIYNSSTLDISIDDILYIHCHQNESHGSPELSHLLKYKVVFIGKDGVPQPTINFSQYWHMVTFLKSIETGLRPNGRFDPPLWNASKDNPAMPDYCVFKIIDNSILHGEIKTKSENEIMKRFIKKSSSSVSSSVASVDCASPKLEPISITMRHDTLRRAFYGWLTYCRHMSTIRLHLTQLLYEKKSIRLKKGLKGKVTQETWYEYCKGHLSTIDIFNLIYNGGIDAEIRPIIWPYLLEFYEWGSSDTTCQKIFRNNQIHYEKKLSEWTTAEIIIQQRPKDERRHSYSSETITPTSSLENLFTNDVLEDFALNLQHIDKDVHRCDRNYEYFLKSENLTKLRNVITTFVWENLQIGYMQGFVDILAPLLVIFDEEPITYACFSLLINRLIKNFPSDNVGMDHNLINLKSLVQIFDNEIYDRLIEKNNKNPDSDYGMRFFFSYRWFLLDFKREFLYSDVFLVWETIWAAKYLVTKNFPLFVALAFLVMYRDIILSNKMDFTDVMKFFNEMAEHHDVLNILDLSRNLVDQLEFLIEAH